MFSNRKHFNKLQTSVGYAQREDAFIVKQHDGVLAGGWRLQQALQTMALPTMPRWPPP